MNTIWLACSPPSSSEAARRAQLPEWDTCAALLIVRARCSAVMVTGEPPYDWIAARPAANQLGI